MLVHQGSRVDQRSRVQNGSMVNGSDVLNVVSRSSVDDRGGNGVHVGCALGHDGVESVDGIGSVVNGAHGTVWLHQGVLACGDREWDRISSGSRQPPINCTCDHLISFLTG